MHAIRLMVRQNRLSDPQRIGLTSYRGHVAAGGAWVAEHAGEVAGFAILDVPGRNVWALFVKPSAEGLGIGSSLHDRLVEWATERGLDHLWLATEADTRAELFYQRRGWTRIGLTGAGEVRFERRLGTAD